MKMYDTVVMREGGQTDRQTDNNRSLQVKKRTKLSGYHTRGWGKGREEKGRV